MINAWSLLYDEIYGDDEMTDENKITPQESDEYDPIIGLSTESAGETLNIKVDNLWDSVTIDTSQLYGDEPLSFSTLSDNDDSIAVSYTHLTLPTIYSV